MKMMGHTLIGKKVTPINQLINLIFNLFNLLKEITQLRAF
jgi:hypothetical protein